MNNTWFSQAKVWLVDSTGLAKDALHVYVALALFLGGAILLRRRLSDAGLLLIVLAVALAGEAWDVRDNRAAGNPIILADNLHDLWNTMFWPCLLWLLARLGWFPRVR